jgi:hypothetical protein
MLASVPLTFSSLLSPTALTLIGGIGIEMLLTHLFLAAL